MLKSILASQGTHRTTWIWMNAELDRYLGIIKIRQIYGHLVHNSTVASYSLGPDRHGNGISHVSILGGSISPEHPVIHRQKQRVSTMSSTTKRLQNVQWVAKNASQQQNPIWTSVFDVTLITVPTMIDCGA